MGILGVFVFGSQINKGGNIIAMMATKDKAKTDIGLGEGGGNNELRERLVGKEQITLKPNLKKQQKCTKR